MSQNDLQIIRSAADDLDPERVAREVRFMSAGCKGISYERMRGPKNDDPPTPSTDPLDRRIRRRHRDFNKALLAGRVALEHALQIQDEIVTRLTLEEAQAEIEAETGRGTCSNCGYLAEGSREDRLVKSRCNRCYAYWRAHEGTERPRELWEASL